MASCRENQAHGLSSISSMSTCRCMKATQTERVYAKAVHGLKAGVCKHVLQRHGGCGLYLCPLQLHWDRCNFRSQRLSRSAGQHSSWRSLQHFLILVTNAMAVTTKDDCEISLFAFCPCLLLDYPHSRPGRQTACCGLHAMCIMHTSIQLAEVSCCGASKLRCHV